MIFKHVLRVLFKYNKIIIRHKHKEDHWSVVKKKNHGVDKALNHFDDFYKSVFGEDWWKIRGCLLGKRKYVAVLNNYSDDEDIATNLENIGALNMRTLFNLEKQYIKEGYERRARAEYLEKIWKMEANEQDTKVENKSDNSSDASKVEDKKEYSLEASLRDASIDVSRIVDENDTSTTSILSQFLPATKIKGKENWIPESDHYKYYEKGSKVPITIEKEYDFHFPKHLNIYCYEENNRSNFPSPKKGLLGVYNYYLMDGGSILPVLALDIKPGHKVFDMCAAPGGKTVVALQTLYPNYVHCNDISWSRFNQIYTVLKEYLFDLDERWLNNYKLKITQNDACNIHEDYFDRILVDVPCTTDRLAVTNNDNNIFKAGRTKERLKIPEIQRALLVHALKLIKIGGIVVYSTCSLSPIQNDGVVGMALRQIWEETDIQIIVKDLSRALVQVQSVYKLADQSLLKYGHLVIPCKEHNYGPTYFCKLKRIK